MQKTSTNITQKYCQKTHYNYVKNSGFGVLSFAGKERDSETGFSYFGARYYDSDILTGWLSVDPLADKYPGLSPYAYCALNPIRVVDPNGDSIIINKFGYVIRNDNTDNKVFLKENNRITNLGELGGKIDVDYIYSNLLKKMQRRQNQYGIHSNFENLLKLMEIGI